MNDKQWEVFCEAMYGIAVENVSGSWEERRDLIVEKFNRFAMLDALQEFVSLFDGYEFE